MTLTVLMPLPKTDFDPTESAVTWKVLTAHGLKIVFATPEGKIPHGDERMLTGQGLGLWRRLLKADSTGLLAYQEMINSQEFQNPISWEQAQENQFSAIALAGGHAPGMKEYLESKTLQNLIADFFKAKKVIGAICHGVVLAARTKDKNNESFLKGYKVTALLETQELTAWLMTCLWLKNYYRTYPESVQSEVTRNLAKTHDFITGPMPLKRDSLQHLEHGFIVKDKNLITARWPGDAHLFASKLAQAIKQSQS